MKLHLFWRIESPIHAIIRRELECDKSWYTLQCIEFDIHLISITCIVWRTQSMLWLQSKQCITGTPKHCDWPHLNLSYASVGPALAQCWAQPERRCCASALQLVSEVCSHFRFHCIHSLMRFINISYILFFAHFHSRLTVLTVVI